jgi:aminoglycoside/choline kinase family phosphotransferase
MIPPATAPDFLARSGWEGAVIHPLAGDASFRRYFRVVDGDRTAVLMDAPPEHEDSRPFLSIAAYLESLGFSAPHVMARDLDRGLILLEDFGDARVNPLLESKPDLEREIYERAIDLLAELHRSPPGDVPPYDAPVLHREAGLLTEWYAPALSLTVDAAGFPLAWDAVFGAVLAETASRPVLVLRDYHADNLMWLPDRAGTRALGLLDFQDGLAGHPAYDLVSLLQDARRDVDPALEEAMIDRYVAAAKVPDPAAFRAAYEVLGAQRNTKILGIFTRLWKRDGKPAYLAFQPRVWGYLERNLAHPALVPVRTWFDANVPVSARADAWRKYT